MLSPEAIKVIDEAKARDTSWRARSLAVDRPTRVQRGIEPKLMHGALQVLIEAVRGDRGLTDAARVALATVARMMADGLSVPAPLAAHAVRVARYSLAQPAQTLGITPDDLQHLRALADDLWFNSDLHVEAPPAGAHPHVAPASALFSRVHGRWPIPASMPPDRLTADVLLAVGLTLAALGFTEEV